MPGISEFKISSFLVDDINGDELNDLVITIDIPMEDGSEKTIIVKALQDKSMFKFNLDKIDLDVGKFILIDSVSFGNYIQKDFVIVLKN